MQSMSIIIVLLAALLSGFEGILNLLSMMFSRITKAIDYGSRLSCLRFFGFLRWHVSSFHE